MIFVSKRIFRQACLLLLAILLVTGCSTSRDPETADAPTPTATWVPVPTFTATVEQSTDEATRTEGQTDNDSTEPATVQSVIPSEAERPDNDSTEALTILVPTATPTSTLLISNTPTAQSNEPYLIVAAEIVNVRRGPGIGYEQLGSVNIAEEWPLIGRNQQGNWWQICCFADDQPGWLYGELVEVVDADAVAVALDIPPLPTPLPPTPAPPTPAPEVVAAPDLPDAPPAQEEQPETITLPTPDAVPLGQSGTAGNFDPNAQFQIVQYRVIGYGENNGGIFNNGGQHMIFVNVIDENGQGIDGAVVKDALADDLHIVTGSKGPGRAEFEMFWEPYKLYVASIPAGPVTSQISNQMNTAKPHIPDIIGKLGPVDEEYAICPTADDRCEPPFFHAHWSYEITFQKVK